MSPATRGVVVVLAGLGLTVALSSLFVWVLIGAELLAPLSAGGAYGWSVRQLSVPFALACGAFVAAMIVGGVLQDRLGPRWPSTAGGVLIGLGMVLASMSGERLTQTSSLGSVLVLGLGFMVGSGAGLTLASTIPPAVKWSAPRHRGMVMGVVLSGLAVAPAWVNASLVAYIRARGVALVLLIQGVALLGVIVVLSQLLEDPLLGYVPPGSYSDADGVSASPVPWTGLTWRLMVRTSTFRALWASAVLLSGASASLLILNVLSPASYLPDGSAGGLAIALCGSAGGIVAGLLYDRIGQRAPWPVFAFLVAILATAAALDRSGLVKAASYLTAAGFVGTLVAAWVCTSACFGTRSAGTNFGLVFTGWSLGFVAGALCAVGVAGSTAGSFASSATMTVAAVVFFLGLVGAVLIAGQVRPHSPRLAAESGLRSQKSRVRR